MTEFLEEVIEALTAEEEVRTFGEVMVPVFDILLGRTKDLDLCQMLLYSYLDVLLYFTRQKDTAKVGACAWPRAAPGLCPQEGRSQGLVCRARRDNTPCARSSPSLPS